MIQFLDKYLNQLLLIAVILAGSILLISTEIFKVPHHPPPAQTPETTPQPLEIAHPTTTQSQEIVLSPPLLSSITWSDQPIAQLGWQKIPRLDLVAPKGTAVALRIYLDKNLICDLNGTIAAQIHRPFAQGFRVDGACDKLPQLSQQNQHEYQVIGHLKLAEDEPQPVNITTGPKLMTEVLIPSVEINWQGDVKIVLAIK